MNQDTRAYVLQLLESYHERERKIALLCYELGHQANVASSGTLYCTCGSAELASQLNWDVTDRMVQQMEMLKQEQARLLYYIALLDEQESTVIKMFYCDNKTMENIAKDIGSALRTAYKVKDRALEHLVSLYDFATSLR